MVIKNWGSPPGWTSTRESTDLDPHMIYSNDNRKKNKAR